LDKFDKSRTYVSTWIAEGHSNPAPEALAYFDAIPRSWDIAAKDTYPDPIVSAADGRTRALQAYENRGF
jgi:deoxyribodipyrimidine photo-lyase